ncbi:GYD domain-containing protein [candidate division KSB1 bacterium]|nr:GYD domain-containing protein [candidate division KSB1 bacterium]
MATFITLLHYSQRGMENIKDGPTRLDKAKDIYKAMGAEIKGFYLTMGRFDAVVVIEAPDDVAIAKATLAIGSQGNISTETLRAFPENEYRKIIAALP